MIVALEGGPEAAEDDRVLLELFADRLAAAFDNAVLHGRTAEANSILEQRVPQRTTELLAANRRLEAQWARARRTTAFQNEVLGIVAHDLKNPLSVIMGRTEILYGRARRSRTPSAIPPATRSSASANWPSRLTGMVDSLIKDAMADASDIPVHRERTDLGALVREAVDANRPLAERKAQALTFEGPTGIMIACDPERMREAVDNLVGNAVKYSPAGGQIAVTLERSRREARIRVQRQRPGAAAGRLSPSVRPVSAALCASDGRRELDRARPVHRQADRRAAWRPDRSALARAQQGDGLHIVLDLASNPEAAA